MPLQEWWVVAKLLFSLADLVDCQACLTLLCYEGGKTAMQSFYTSYHK